MLIAAPSYPLEPCIGIGKLRVTRQAIRSTPEKLKSVSPIALGDGATEHLPSSILFKLDVQPRQAEYKLLGGRAHSLTFFKLPLDDLVLADQMSSYLPHDKITVPLYYRHHRLQRSKEATLLGRHQEFDPRNFMAYFTSSCGAYGLDESPSQISVQTKGLHPFAQESINVFA